MKIILSRKGFDSGTGKVASPIFPSGALCSLPIPESPARACLTRYNQIVYDGQSLGKIASDLTRGRVAPDSAAHLDPDLHEQSLPRAAGWKPVFGQAAAAERHLQNQGVATGDVFIFYGWFRRVEYHGGMFRFVAGEPDLHVIFGWLQIEQRIPVTRHEHIPAWAHYHPHCHRVTASPYNSLYLAADKLTLPGATLNMPGAGTFDRYHPTLCLTDTEPYVSRRIWRLPAWMHPGAGNAPLTYHADLARWQLREDHVLLQSVGRGQEFVLDSDEYPPAIAWLADLFTHIAP